MTGLTGAAVLCPWLPLAADHQHYYGRHLVGVPLYPHTLAARGHGNSSEGIQGPWLPSACNAMGRRFSSPSAHGRREHCGVAPIHRESGCPCSVAARLGDQDGALGLETALAA